MPYNRALFGGVPHKSWGLSMENWSLRFDRKWWRFPWVSVSLRGSLISSRRETYIVLSIIMFQVSLFKGFNDIIILFHCSQLPCKVNGICSLKGRKLKYFSAPCSIYKVEKEDLPDHAYSQIPHAKAQGLPGWLPLLNQNATSAFPPWHVTATVSRLFSPDRPIFCSCLHPPPG